MMRNCRCCKPPWKIRHFSDRELRPYAEGRKAVSDDDHMVLYYLAERARSGRLTLHEQVELGEYAGLVLAERRGRVAPMPPVGNGEQ